MTSLMSDSNVVEATLSGDGRYLAYVKGPQGNWSLWVRQVATGSDISILPPQRLPIGAVSFSPDGNYVYYLGNDPETPAYYALFEVPSLGGTPRKRLFDVDTALSFAPDGRRAAFIRSAPDQGQDHLMMVDLQSGQESVLHTVKQPEELHRDRPGWSPDGARVVVARHALTDDGVRHSLAALELETKGFRDITAPRDPSIESFQWLPDGSGLIVTTDQGSGRSPQIFFAPYPLGEMLQITTDLDRYSHISLTSDGRSIAALRASRDSSLWSVPAGGGDARQITTRSTSDGIEDVTHLPDGSVAFVATKDNRRHVWTMNPDGTGRGQVTSLDGWCWRLRALPDAAGFVFNHYSREESTSHVWRVDRDGGNIRRITDGTGEAVLDLSPDGGTLLYNLMASPRDLHIVPLEGGEPRRIADDYVSTARFSPDGRLIAYVIWQELEGRQREVIVIRPADGGEPVVSRHIPGGVTSLGWMADGRDLAYATVGEAVSNVWRLPIDGGEPVRLTRFDKGLINYLASSPDGSAIAVERVVDGVEEVWTIDPAAGDPAQVSRFGSGEVFQLDWARDSKNLFVVQGDVRRAVVLIEDASQPPT